MISRRQPAGHRSVVISIQGNPCRSRASWLRCSQAGLRPERDQRSAQALGFHASWPTYMGDLCMCRFATVVSLRCKRILLDPSLGWVYLRRLRPGSLLALAPVCCPAATMISGGLQGLPSSGFVVLLRIQRGTIGIRVRARWNV